MALNIGFWFEPTKIIHLIAELSIFRPIVVSNLKIQVIIWYIVRFIMYKNILPWFLVLIFTLHFSSYCYKLCISIGCRQYLGRDSKAKNDYMDRWQNLKADQKKYSLKNTNPGGWTQVNSINPGGNISLNSGKKDTNRIGLY